MYRILRVLIQSEKQNIGKTRELMGLLWILQKLSVTFHYWKQLEKM